MTRTVPESTIQFWLQALLRLATHETAFPWQLELFDRLRRGPSIRGLDIPTGLGKTSVMAIWLAARACGARQPRRLVYVVDRRAVVDQATEVALGLRECVDGTSPELRALKTALGIAPEKHLPISTLRGQYADNREWLDDPASPAVIVGTVDMIGSRLLFEGYGVSRKMRPYHAGLLGADTLVILDEAHLVPPFERLLEAIANGAEEFGPSDPTLRTVVPSFELMSLSATGRKNGSSILRLSDKDRTPGTITRKRLDSQKRLSIEALPDSESLAVRLANEAWSLSEHGALPIRCLIFANARKDAEAARNELDRLQTADRKAGKLCEKPEVELFVGGRRVWERERAAQRLKEMGFIAGSNAPRRRSAFVCATSAAEVGVDLDADHLVCDLVEWERMVQRLGRVNRRGEGDAKVLVFWSTNKSKDEFEQQRSSRLNAVSQLLQRLPSCRGGGVNASPGAILDLKERADRDPELEQLVAEASSPAPLHPPLTRPLIEAWSMTSLDAHTGRPDVGPWLRGWVDDEEPKTSIIWREILPVTFDGKRLLAKEDCDLYLEAAAPHTVEVLETESWRAGEWFVARVNRLKRTRVGRADQASSHEHANGASTEDVSSDEEPLATPPRIDLDPAHIVGVIVDKDGQLLSLTANFTDDKRKPLNELLHGAVLFVDTRLGGLGLETSAVQGPREVTGLLDAESDYASDVSQIAQAVFPFPFRIRRSDKSGSVDDTGSSLLWREEARIVTRREESSEAPEAVEWITVESSILSTANTEEARSVAVRRAQRLEAHERLAEQEALSLAHRLGIDPTHAQVLAVAARLHDDGKRAKRWQRAFRAPDGAVYAKTTTRPDLQLLGGYRHELGSLSYAERDASVLGLPPELRDLCLHIIAAHHGRARPILPVAGAEEPPSQLVGRAQEVALRFARLERKWGPWGLAWWESLLRAVDQTVSRRNDESQEGEPSSG